jgi:uncharacterized protein (TIGR02611 family)
VALARAGAGCLAVNVHPYVIETWRGARRVIIAVVGFTLLALGVVMIVTPGPGWLVIILGLGVLSGEFIWARRLLRRLKQTGAQVGEAIFGKREAKLD